MDMPPLSRSDSQSALEDSLVLSLRLFGDNDSGVGFSVRVRLPSISSRHSFEIRVLVMKVMSRTSNGVQQHSRTVR